MRLNACFKVYANVKLLACPNGGFWKVSLIDGQLWSLETKRKGKAQIPLGWALSKETQEQIDKEIDKKIDGVVKEIESLLPDK